MHFRFHKNKTSKSSSSGQNTVSPASNNSSRSESDFPSSSIGVTTAAALSPTSLTCNAKVTLSAFKYTLDALEKAPIPDIGVVASALTRIIDNLQAMSQAQVGWQALADRLQRLVFVLDAIAKGIEKYPKLQARTELSRTSLKEALDKLAEDVDKAMQENNLITFLNDTDEMSAVAVHKRKLDSITGELTLVFCAVTPVTEEDIETAFYNMITRVQEEIAKEGHTGSNGMFIQIMDNVIESEVLRLLVGNQMIGPGRMDINVSRNRIVSKEPGKVEVVSHNQVIAPGNTSISSLRERRLG